jgi:anti-sigma factor RsiW
MSAYVDGELTGADMLGIRRHLSECDDCAQEHESTRSVKQAMSRLRTVAPRKDFAESILAKLEVAEMSPYQRFANVAARFVHGKLSPAAAAIAASGVALMLLTAGGIDRITPQAGLSLASTSSQDVSFVRAIHQPDLSFALARPLVVASQSPESGPEVHFASLTH